MKAHFKNCSTCLHDGCCENLPYCGGLSYVPRYGECSVCGRTFDRELMESGDVCPVCAEANDEGGAE